MRGTKEKSKIFQMKEENEYISFNLFLQVLVLVITERQIYNYINTKTTHPFSLTFSPISFSFDSCVFILCDFISSEKLENISCRIYYYIQKQALRVVL